MSLHPQDIQRIAHLARLQLRADETQEMCGKLNAFFAIVERMRAVDTDGVEPLSHPTAIVQELALRLRPDVVSESNQREANQQSAPVVERGLFLVPRVVE